MMYFVGGFLLSSVLLLAIAAGSVIFASLGELTDPPVRAP